ncbi:MAG: T9SS type A sorting domain-containing protein, partial [Flavobacteriales bacterium]
HWQSSGGQPLLMLFSAGSIESNTWDRIRIYDGPDNLSPLLYTNPAGTTQLAGLELIAGSGHIYMENTSDGSGSCQSGGFTQWAWEIGCLDCTNPGATFSIVEDCIHHAFSVAVNVDSLGSGTFARIANSLSTDTITNVLTGITMVGPFPMDSLVTLTVMNETNNLCRIYSPAFTSASTACVDTVCAATAYDYCYGNSDTAWFAYQGAVGIPLTIEFLWGQLLADDFVQIYNGWVPSAANLIWQGNLNGNLAGWAVNTTSGNKMLMRVVSNSAYSCATGEASPPLHWVVQCGSVGIDENMGTSFSMFPNPTTGELSLQLPSTARGSVDMRVADLSGRTVHHETFNCTGGANTFDLAKLQSGNYVVTITTNDWVKSQQLQIIH